MIEGFLKRNLGGRWQVKELELTPGAVIELLIGGHWIAGTIECWNREYYWFSRGDGVAVTLDASIKARIAPGRYMSG
jgi:hypothetical protein